MEDELGQDFPTRVTKVTKHQIKKKDLGEKLLFKDKKLKIETGQLKLKESCDYPKDIECAGLGTRITVKNQLERQGGDLSSLHIS